MHLMRIRYFVDFFIQEIRDHCTDQHDQGQFENVLKGWIDDRFNDISHDQKFQAQ